MKLKEQLLRIYTNEVSYSDSDEDAPLWYVMLNTQIVLGKREQCHMDIRRFVMILGRSIGRIGTNCPMLCPGIRNISLTGSFAERFQN